MYMYNNSQHAPTHTQSYAKCTDAHTCTRSYIPSTANFTLKPICVYYHRDVLNKTYPYIPVCMHEDILNTFICIYMYMCTQYADNILDSTYNVIHIQMCADAYSYCISKHKSVNRQMIKHYRQH